MYSLTTSEVNFLAGCVFGIVAAVTLWQVPTLRRALLVVAFIWLTWRVYVAGAEHLGSELLGYFRTLAAENGFMRG